MTVLDATPSSRRTRRTAGVIFPLLLGSLPLTSFGAPSKPVRPSAAPPKAASDNTAYCSGEYADSLMALAPKIREMEMAHFSYCIRNTVIYECLSYAPDGNVRRSRRTSISHGTGFGFKQTKDATLLLTNYHVSDFPLVTDDAHQVGSVPIGCKKISESLQIVDNESDSYDRDDIALTRVVQDPQLDAAILKAKDTSLRTIPWKLGKSAALRERNVVEVRGFPLGVFQAVSDGKVISAYDHDTEKDWDHDDFVIDALLSHGNSGSPVLAVSCKTGEFELVGMYHAGYTGASALNVVVGIDQMKDMMNTLKRKPRPHTDPAANLDPAARARLMRDSPSVMESFFPFGPLAAMMLERRDGTILFSLFARGFPLHTEPIAMFEDRPAIGEFGALHRVWFGAPQGLKVYERSDFDAETLGQMERVLDGLRRVALAAMEYRAAVSEASGSREQFERMSRLERALSRAAETRADLANIAVDLSERLGPKGYDNVVTLAGVLTSTSVMSPAAAADLTSPANGTGPTLFEPTVKPRHPFTNPE
jgi:serine protease Do